MNMHVKPSGWASWDSDRDGLLTRLWADGLTTAAIAAQINRETGSLFTRNAVIGRVHRIGLQPRKTAPTPRVKRVRTVGSPPKTPAERQRKHREKLKMNPAGGQYEVVTEYIEAPPIEDSAIPIEQRKQLVDIAPGECHWPVGDPKHADFFFCGGLAVEGKPYCARHCQMAYQPRRTEKFTDPYIAYLKGEYRRKAA